MARLLMTSQAGAYYNPDTATFYVLMSKLPAAMLNVLFAHELYHGLQDQYFDLNDYLLDQTGGGNFTDDELMARQCVVEGEATLMMTMWMVRFGVGGVGLDSPVNQSALEMAINMQRNLSLDQIRQQVTAEGSTGIDLGDLGDAVEAMDELPRFLLETLVGAYIKGMGFVWDVYKRGGWDEVERLYTSDPPVSTEQILHADKWFNGERPYCMKWPDLDEEEVLEGWELIDRNTLGELQWRIIFEEYDMGRRAHGIAEGWDGDSYCVFKRADSDRMLLLLYTCWDTDGDALQFIDAYQELLEAKYPEGVEQTIIERGGRDVIVLEGGLAEEAEGLVDFMKRVDKRK
jgi:hypothetical protein